MCEAQAFKLSKIDTSWYRCVKHKHSNYSIRHNKSTEESCYKCEAFVNRVQQVVKINMKKRQLMVKQLRYKQWNTQRSAMIWRKHIRLKRAIEQSCAWTLHNWIMLRGQKLSISTADHNNRPIIDDRLAVKWSTDVSRCYVLVRFLIDWYRVGLCFRMCINYLIVYNEQVIMYVLGPFVQSSNPSIKKSINQCMQ